MIEDNKLLLLEASLRMIEEDLNIYIYENKLDIEDPFQNTGETEGFKNDVFEVHAYDWSWDVRDDNAKEPLNFKWKDFEVYWYKYLGRGMYVNRDISLEEIMNLLVECTESLRDS